MVRRHSRTLTCTDSSRYVLGYFAAMVEEILWLNTAQAKTGSRRRVRQEYPPGGRHHTTRSYPAFTGTSLRTLVGIVEDGPTFETANLAGPLAALR